MSARLPQTQSLISARSMQPTTTGTSAMPTRAMTTLWLLWQFVWRAGLRGLLGGLVLGGLFGMLFFIVGAIYGAPIGAIVGTAVGLANGLVMGLVTCLFFFPLVRPRLYYRVIICVNLVVTILASLAGFTSIWRIDDVISLVPTIIASLYSIWASHKSVRWYEQQIALTRSGQGAYALPPVLPAHRQDYYQPAFVQQLFDTMQDSYERVSNICSFGFNRRWRRQLLALMQIDPGMHVCDLMAGTGETWQYILPQVGSQGSLAAVDFSHVMAQRARERAQALPGYTIAVREEDVLNSTLPPASFDAIVCVYGVKLLNPKTQERFVHEIRRILKPNGTFGIVEIALPQNPLLRWPYRFYLSAIIPLIGVLFLANHINYRMLGRYLVTFEDCHRLERLFTLNGFEVHSYALFGGCAGALVGMKRTP
ncbi:MAG: class I SAM-dependent methyltransferase [Chloroflexaceae bacterium]